MKKFLSISLLFTVMWFAQGCGDNKDSSSSTATTVSTDTSAKTSSVPVDADSKDFVMKAASGGMMEVELGKVAQQKAQDPRVKNFGQMMVDDHSKANDELKGIASSKNIMIPDKMMDDHQKHVDEMSKKSGKDFDKAYMDMMLNDHKEDIGDFKKASENSKDADIKGFAGKTLPVLQKHLDSAQAIHGK